jgi:hypothetical protein
MIEGRMLALLKVTPAFPPTRYVALYRGDQRSSLIASVTKLAQDSCDFDLIFQTDESQPVQEPPSAQVKRRRKRLRMA